MTARAHRFLPILSLVLPFVAVTSFSAQAPVPFAQCAGSLSKAELDSRIDALIAQMTPAERIAQLQDRAPAIPRLGIPAYNWWNEGLHGIARNGYATVFPQAIGLGATWDAELLREVGDTIATEARAKFNPHRNADSPRYAGLTIWSPNINIFRDPRWGRGQETYGEDPYLTGLLGGAFVAGIQGHSAAEPQVEPMVGAATAANPARESGFYRKADATPKHFAVHSGPESIRDGFNSVVSQHDLVDTYTPAFRALTGRDGARAAGLMCSYNAINGTPACANPLLAERVRGAWGFEGYMVSDCDAVDEITEYLHYTPDQARGAASALKAGVDLDCGGTYAHLAEALDQKLIALDDIDRALHRLLMERLRLGMLQPAACSPWAGIGPQQVDTPKARALALRAAEESMVLLRNRAQTLPLAAMGKGTGRRIAVIGPTADLLGVIEANYHGTARYPQTILDGLRDGLAPGTGNRRDAGRNDTRTGELYAQGSALAEGVMLPVARTALRPSLAADAAEGLRGEYFRNPDLSGKPAKTRIDATIDLDLDRIDPVDEAAAGQPYSIRWTGYLAPPGPGAYRLRVAIERCWDCTRHDGYRLWIDGKLALANDGKGGVKSVDGVAVADPAQADSVEFNWPDSRPRAIRLEFAHTGEDEGIRLDWQAPSAAQLAEAVAAAKRADAVVALVGLSPDLEGEALRIKVPGFDGGDRVTLGLPEPQRALLQALGDVAKAAGKPFVVVVTGGGAVALGSEADAAQAVIAAWYPGEEGGHALANLLRGKVSPSGRLPVTVYRSEADLPAFTDYSMARRTYRYFDGPVEYPFGFGLSYEKFQYSPTELVGPGGEKLSSISAGEPLAARATVTNRGRGEADEVAQMYLIFNGREGDPRIALQGAQRVRLRAGESRSVEFRLSSRQLSAVDAEGLRSVRPGSCRVYVGGSLPADLKAAGTNLTIVGTAQVSP